MSRTYEANLVIGCFFSEIDEGKYYDISSNEDELDEADYKGSFYKDYLYNIYDIIYYEEDDFIGFEVDSVQDVTYTSASKLQAKAKEFQKITGVKAKLASCLYSY